MTLSEKNKLKIHFFKDCSGIHWGEHSRSVIEDISRITCGQCKGRILEVLRQKDWSTLGQEELEVLEIAAYFANLEDK